MSELILSAHRAGFIREDTIRKLAKDILSVPERELLDKQDLMQIQRQNPWLETINGLEFHYMKVMYPMIVRRSGNYDICTEIIVREKQRAVGIQPMLFLCLPILCLEVRESTHWTDLGTEGEGYLEHWSGRGGTSRRTLQDVRNAEPEA